jgi:cytochrome c-type biogenesis protein CcmE
MKKIHITIIITIAIISAILVSTYTSAVSNTTFNEAKVESGKQVKIVGNFDKTKGVEYDAVKNPNLTVFNVVDKNGQSERVCLTDKNGKPMGLEQSESVTIEGQFAEDGTFKANHLLMKCPSKYNDQKHSLASE